MKAEIILTQFWWKHLRRYCIHPVFWLIECSDLDFWSQKLINTSTDPNTSVTKTGWNSLHNFVRFWDTVRCSQSFRDAQTHALTDGGGGLKLFQRLIACSWIFSKRLNVVEIILELFQQLK